MIDPLPELAGLLEAAIDLMRRHRYRRRHDQAGVQRRAGCMAPCRARAAVAAGPGNPRAEATGIKNLRVQYNRVFGYHIEVTKSYYHLVPTLQRRQTLASSERYTTEELKEIEQKVVGAEGEAIRLESELFDGIREQLLQLLPALQETARGFKTLDALLSLARVARENAYVCPTLNDAGSLDIREGRHPVVEKTLGEGSFVPNDTVMNADDKRMLIVTGPNMAGKSTYLRQTALIVLMAHIGSFVPAQSADIPLTDNIYTRIGASDDLAGGRAPSWWR